MNKQHYPRLFKFHQYRSVAVSDSNRQLGLKEKELLFKKEIQKETG